MGFNFFRWLSKSSGDTANVEVKNFLDEEIGTITASTEIYLQRLAFWTCIRKIGYAVGSVEWETYRRGKKVKAKEYWAWNYAPNPNQTRVEFFVKLIGELYLRQEAIIIELPNGARYVADGYSTTTGLMGDTYSNITVRGESVQGVFKDSDVLHLKMDGEPISRILASITTIQGKLLASGTSAYIRRSGKHGVLKIDEVAEADQNFEETYSELVNEKFKKYFTAEHAVLPLYNGYTYDEDKTDSQTAQTTRDIRALMDDIIELTAQAFGVPTSICTGKTVSATDFNAFMTSTVQPIVTMITNEINKKIFGQQLVFAGTYITANLAAVRFTDLFDVANPIDKLIGSGAFCVNDIRTRLGMDIIDAPWAWQHWMTKNYSSVEELLTCVESSEDQENKKGETEDENKTDQQDTNSVFQH